MAQSAKKRMPLGFDAFWDKRTTHPTLRWDKWRVQLKLALPCQGKRHPRYTPRPKTLMVEHPLEPIYEEKIVGSSA